MIGKHEYVFLLINSYVQVDTVKFYIFRHCGAVYQNALEPYSEDVLIDNKYTFTYIQIIFIPRYVDMIKLASATLNLKNRKRG